MKKRLHKKLYGDKAVRNVNVTWCKEVCTKYKLKYFVKGLMNSIQLQPELNFLGLDTRKHPWRVPHWNPRKESKRQYRNRLKNWLWLWTYEFIVILDHDYYPIGINEDAFDHITGWEIDPS